MANLNQAQLAALIAGVRGPPPESNRKIREFSSADGDEWLVWRKMFETVCDIANWGALRARQECQSAMAGVAARQVEDIPLLINPPAAAAAAAVAAAAAPAAAAGGPVAAAVAAAAAAPAAPPVGPVAMLLDAYEVRFRPESASDAAVSTYHEATQREGETVHEWHARIRSLFKRANPQATAVMVEASRDLRLKFIMGLRNRLVMSFAHKLKPANFNEALNLVSGLVASEDMIASKHGAVGGIHSMSMPFGLPPGPHPQYLAAVNAITGLPQQASNYQQHQAIQAMGRRPFGGGRGGPMGTDTCFYCHKPGHQRKDCFHYTNFLRQGNTAHPNATRGRGRPVNRRFNNRPLRLGSPAGPRMPSRAPGPNRRVQSLQQMAQMNLASLNLGGEQDQGN